jgi:broad specificity phosphatase PhoE
VGGWRRVLIFVRHGQSEANAAGLLAGRLDSPVTELGLLQAGRLGDALAAAGVKASARVACSPLRRTVATAERICEALGRETPPLVEDRLIELDYGVFDGMPMGEVPADAWSSWRADAAWRPEGGETLLEVQSRVESWITEVADEAGSGDVVAVTHVSPIKAAAAWAMGVGPEVSWRLSLGVSSITRVSTRPRIALASFGETGHLAGL